MRTTRCAILGLTASVFGAPGPISTRQGADFSAVTQEHGVLATSPPATIDWEATARRHFTRFDPFALDATARAEILTQATDFGMAEIPYAAPLPPDVTAGRYYLATPSGVQEVRPIQLRGIVRFEVDSRGRLEDAPPRFYGYLVLGPSDSAAAAEGGLAFRLSSPWPQSDRDAAVRSRAAFLAAGLPPEPAKDDRAAWFQRVIMEYELAVGGRRYVFQQLAPDDLMYEAGCRRRFRIFQAAPRQLMAELNAECDV